MMLPRDWSGAALLRFTCWQSSSRALKVGVARHVGGRPSSRFLPIRHPLSTLSSKRSRMIVQSLAARTVLDLALKERGFAGG